MRERRARNVLASKMPFFQGSRTVVHRELRPICNAHKKACADLFPPPASLIYSCHLPIGRNRLWICREIPTRFCLQAGSLARSAHLMGDLCKFWSTCVKVQSVHHNLLFSSLIHPLGSILNFHSFRYTTNPRLWLYIRREGESRIVHHVRSDKMMTFMRVQNKSPCMLHVAKITTIRARPRCTAS